MFPWPVFGIIIYYSNSWHLNRVCKKFQFYVEKLHKFKFADIDAIVEKSSVRVLEFYLKQYSYSWRGLNHMHEFTYRDVEVARHVVANYEHNKTHGLYLACKGRCTEAIVYFIDNADIDMIFDYICISGDVNEFNKWYQRTKNVDFKYVCASGNMELIKLCIELGHANYEEGLAGAFMSGKVEVIQLFEPIKINNLFRGNFQYLCNKNPEALLYILKTTGYKPTREDVLSAAWGGCVEITEILTEKMIAVNFEQEMEIACDLGYLDLVKYYVKKGCVPTGQNFMTAIFTSRTNVVEYLLLNHASEEIAITPDIIKLICAHKRYVMCSYLSQFNYVCTNCKTAKCPLSTPALQHSSNTLLEKIYSWRRYIAGEKDLSALSN